MFDVVGGNETLDILVNGAKAQSILLAVSDAKSNAVKYYKGKVDMSRPLYAGGPSRQF